MAGWLVLAVGPRSLHPARVFRSFPTDSIPLLTARVVCAREGRAVALQHQREVSLATGPDNVKRKKNQKNATIRETIKEVRE